MKNSLATDETSAKQQEQAKIIFPYQPDGEYTFKVTHFEEKRFYSFLKRTLDLLGGVVGLLLFSPLMLLIACAIKLTSKGPIIYKQERLGYGGKVFQMPKFRTMVVDAEKDGARWSEGDLDDRIYPFGGFLRKTRLDELPQLWCCVTGQMSFIGPRPERECFALAFEQYIHGFSERLRVKPGITGWAQVNGGYDLRPEEKIVYDIEYIENRSIGMDLKILCMTFGVVLCRKGAK